MDSKLLVGLIKEVVKNEVNRQVKEEISKLVKSGVINLNKNQISKPASSISETKSIVKPKPNNIVQQQKQIKKEYSKNPILNEVLNMTTPFGAEHRVEGSAGGSILDMIQRGEDEWGEIRMTTKNMSADPVPTSVPENSDVNVVMKALNRDYTELVKRFK